MACRPAARIDVGDTVDVEVLQHQILLLYRYNNIHMYISHIICSCDTYDLISLDFHECGKLEQAEFVRGNGASLPRQLGGGNARLNFTRDRCRWFARCVGGLGERLDAVIIETIGQCKCVMFFPLEASRACVANLLLRCARLQTGLPKLLKKERKRESERQLMICIIYGSYIIIVSQNTKLSTRIR